MPPTGSDWLTLLQVGSLLVSYLVQHFEGGQVVHVFLLPVHLHVASSLRVDALMPDVSKTQSGVLLQNHSVKRCLSGGFTERGRTGRGDGTPDVHI